MDMVTSLTATTLPYQRDTLRSSIVVIRIAAWSPRPSGRDRNAASPPRECRWWSLVCSYVPIPPAAHARPGGGAAWPLRPRPVRVEPRGRAASALAPGSDERSRTPGAVPAAHRGPGGAPVAGRGLADGSAAGAEGLRQGDSRVLRPAEPGWATVVAQGGPERGVPRRRATGAEMGRAPPVQGRRPGAGPAGRVGAVPLVPLGTTGRQVLPGDPGPRRALARRLRRDSRSGPGTGQRPGRGDRPGHRRAEGPPGRPPQGLGREDQHRPGAPVRPDQGRGFGRQGHDPLGQGNRRDAWTERPAEGRAEPRHPRLGLGSAGTTPGRQGV